jgi:GST-like protein
VATDLSPFSGQAVHFRHMAPEPKEYAHRRYQFEAERHYGVLDRRLAGNRHMLGDEYNPDYG